MDLAIDYLRTSGFRYVEIGKREGMRAAEIARIWNMKGADALHLAVAELAGCNQFQTRDHDQRKAGALSSMVISGPIGLSQTELDFTVPDQ